MQWLPASVGQEGTAQREHTCPQTLRALHPHFEAPRSPLDATAAQAAQAERTQTARREDKTTNQQTTDFVNSPPVQRQAGAAANGTAGAATGAEAVVELVSTCTVRCGAVPPDPDPEDPGLFFEAWYCC